MTVIRKNSGGIKNKIPESIKQKACDLYLSGMTCRQAAAAVGVSYCPVNLFIKKLGLIRPKIRCSEMSKYKDAIRLYVEEEKTMAEVAECLNLKLGTAQRWIKISGKSRPHSQSYAIGFKKGRYGGEKTNRAKAIATANTPPATPEEAEKRRRAVLRAKKWASEHPEKIKIKGQLYRTRHPEKGRASSARYFYKYHEQNKLKNRIKSKLYARNNPEKVKSSHRRWLSSGSPASIFSKIVNGWKSKIVRYVKSGKKSSTIHNVIGCSRDTFLQRIEAQFQPGMSWLNHGRHGWHLDHITPCVAFNLHDPEQLKVCFRYDNYQPLWWWQNLEKGDRLDYAV